MKRQQITVLLWRLVSAYPAQARLEKGSVDVYVEGLETYRTDAIAEACKVLASKSKFFPSLAELVTEVGESYAGIHERRLEDDASRDDLGPRARNYLRRFFACEPGLVKPERIRDEALKARVYALWPEIAKELGIDYTERMKALSDKLAGKLEWPKRWRTREQPWGR